MVTDLVVLMVAAIANGLIILIPYRNHTMLRVGGLQSGAGGLLVSTQQPQGPLLAYWCPAKAGWAGG